MVDHDQVPNPPPRLSIVIVVYNDWTMLDGCLQWLKQQTNPPRLEVVIVDDGSAEPAPEFIQRWSSWFPVTIVRQNHAGIPSARNLGIQHSIGPLILFVDADSRVQMNCLAALVSTVDNSPQHGFFQLRLVGDCSELMGRSEELRLMALQTQLLQPDGRIRFLNTAGFAIRRDKLDHKMNLFDPTALRGEDTLLLADLIQRGDLPLFVPNAIVLHGVPSSLIEGLRKWARVAFQERRTNEMIASRGVRIRVGSRERLSMLRSSWKASRQHSIGRSAWFLLVARQSLQRMITLLFSSTRTFAKPPTPPSAIV